MAKPAVQLLYLAAVYAWRVAAASGGTSSGGRRRAPGALYGLTVMSPVL